MSLSSSALGTWVWLPLSLTKQIQSQEWHKISTEQAFSSLQPSLPGQLEWEKATWLTAAHSPVLRGLGPQHPSFARASAKE